MNSSTIDNILENLHNLQKELEHEIDLLLTEKRRQFRYSIEQGKVRFEKSMQALQRKQKIGLLAYIGAARIGHILSAPVAYSLLLPFVLLDIGVTIFQHICFRIYAIPLVTRKDYIVLDRHHLAYLNIIEKINCVYCGYGNGLVAYVREIAARTEQYWCPVKHAQRSMDPHRFEESYLEFGDAENYQAKLQQLRAQMAGLNKSEQQQK